MSFNRITNFVILVLMVAAIYQTGTLWLVDTASHNVFYTTFMSLNQNRMQAGGEGELLIPTKVAVGKGNKKFTLFYPEEEKSNTILEQANDFLYEILEKGTSYEGKNFEDWNEILASKCLLFQYDFFVPIQEYRKKSAKLQQEEIHSFDQLALIPRQNNDQDVSCYFINSKDRTYLRFSLGKSQYAAGLFHAIESLQEQEELNYVSTEQSGFKLFRGNIFVPQWQSSTYGYAPLVQENPFEKDGVIHRGLLESSVDGFFKNFAADWNSKDENGNYIFSDESVVVRYETQGVLEYYSYESYHDTEKDSFLKGYYTARQFMEYDKSLKTPVYLSDVSVRSNETVYYFDYTKDNFPVMLSEEVKNTIESEHAIEVVIRNHAVKKYRRYAVNFYPNTQKRMEVNKDFLTALNEGIMEYQQGDYRKMVTQVEDIYLGYFAQLNGDVKLYWVTNLYNNDFLIDSQKKVEKEEGLVLSD